MKNVYLLILLGSILSCTIENMDEDSQNENMELNQKVKTDLFLSNKSLNEFYENSNEGQFYSDYLKSSNFNRTDNTDCSGITDDLTDICEDDFDLSTMPHRTYWVPYNSEHYKTLDYQLEQAFQYNWRFNLRLVKRGDPIFVGTGEVEFTDAGYSTGEDWDYEYLSNPVSENNGNLIMQYLACEMQTHMESIGYFVYDVDVYGDILLCGNETRYVRISFKYGY